MAGNAEDFTKQFMSQMFGKEPAAPAGNGLLCSQMLSMLTSSLLTNLEAAYIMSLYSVVVNYNYAHQDNYVNMGLSHLFLVLFFLFLGTL